MPLTSGIKYRLHPDERQSEILSQWIGCQRFIYNAKVSEDKYFRTFSRKSLSLADIYPPVDQKYSQLISEVTTFLKDVPSQILRNGAYRWMTGYQRFFKGLAYRPTFRGKQGRQSVLITSELFVINPLKDEIILGTVKHPVGRIPYTRHGERRPDPKSICIARHAGRWWLSFNYAVEVDVAEEPLTEAELLDLFKSMTRDELLAVTKGCDRGVAVPLADSDETFHHFDLKVKERIAHKERLRAKYQRRFERRKEGSNCQKKTRKQIDLTHEYQANARHDFAHKTSRKLVESGALIIVFEDLKVNNMTRRAKPKQDESGKWVRNGAAAKSGLNRAILGSAWGKIVCFTQYKALRKNKFVVKVKPSGTSQECSHCGHTHPDNRESQSLFVCQSCGREINADYNASINIKVRGVDRILDPEFTLRQKKTVRFRRSAATRDGTPEVKRGETAVSHIRVRPSVQESVNHETATCNGAELLLAA